METVVIQGRQVPFERAAVKPDEVELDPANPRIQFLVGLKAGRVTQQELDEMLWEKDQVKALAGSIKQNGGVYEEIIVQKSGDKLIVREGNSRTVATRHLAQQFPNDPAFSTIPAMIFDVDLTEEDVAVLLADKHVAGKIRWDAYEQAKQVFDLAQIHGKTFDWLSNHLRLSKSKISQDLKAYQATTEFLAVNPEPRNVDKFSFFQELVRKKDLAARFNDDLEFKQTFHRWLKDGKLTDSKQVRNLDSILANPEAALALESGGVRAAEAVLIRDDPALESDVFDAVKRATDKLSRAPMSELIEIKNSPQKIVMLRNLKRQLQDVATYAGVEL